MDVRPEWKPNPAEVAEVIEVPFDTLIDPACRSTFDVERGGVRFTAPCFQFQRHNIWGATSMMLNELLEVTKSEI